MESHELKKDGFIKPHLYLYTLQVRKFPSMLRTHQQGQEKKGMNDMGHPYNLHIRLTFLLIILCFIII